MSMSWTLHLGSCLDPTAGLPSLGRGSVDHVICDPPYEGQVHTEGRRIRAGSFAQEQAAGRDVVLKPISYPPITEAERCAVAAQMARVAKRWILVFCQVEAAMLWRVALEAGGAEYVRTGAWVKTDAQPQLSGDRPGQGWEAIVIAHAARAAGGAAAELPLLAGLGVDERTHVGRMRWNGGGKCATWRYSSRDTGGDLTRRKLVDGQKPLALMRELVTLFTDPGELICDPYAGAGTTLLAAALEQRYVVGWELLPQHHQRASDRLTAALRES